MSDKSVDLVGRRESQMLEQERGSLSQQLWEVLTPCTPDLPRLRYYSHLELSDTKVSLNYEPSSEPLHNSAKPYTLWP